MRELSAKQRKSVAFVLFVCQNNENDDAKKRRKKPKAISVNDISISERDIVSLSLSNNKRFRIDEHGGVHVLTNL